MNAEARFGWLVAFDLQLLGRVGIGLVERCFLSNLVQIILGILENTHLLAAQLKYLKK